MSKETEKPVLPTKKNPLKEIWENLKKKRREIELPVEETPAYSVTETPVTNPYTSPIEATSAQHLESLLFQYGTLAYNPELVAELHSRLLSSRENWLKKYRKDRGINYIKRMIEEYKQELAVEDEWLKKYQGIVPMHWNFWAYIIRDFNTAESLGLEINSVLVRAALEHDHWQVREAAATFSPTRIRTKR